MTATDAMLVDAVRFKAEMESMESADNSRMLRATLMRAITICLEVEKSAKVPGDNTNCVAAAAEFCKELRDMGVKFDEIMSHAPTA